MPLLIFLIICVSLTSFFILDPDLGWHLYLGKHYLESKSLTSGFFGYNTFSNLPLSDHESISEIIIYWCYHHLGFWSLALGCCIILLLILYFQKKISRLFSIKSDSFCILFILFLAVLLEFFSVRIQLIILLGASSLLLLTKKYSNNKLFLPVIFILFLIGNNLHGGFLILAPIPILILLERMSKKNIKKASLTALTILFALLINFNGSSFFKLIIDYLSDPSYKKMILEWMSIYSFPLNLLIIVCVSTALFLLMLKSYWKEIPRNELFMLILYLLLGIQYRRFCPLFFILAAPYLAQSFQENIVSIISPKIIRFFAFFAAAFFSISIIGKIFIALYSNPGQPLNPFYQDQYYPQKAAVFLQQNPPPQNFLNPYSYGGFLLWRTNIPVFIDGRAPQARTGDSTLLQEYSLLYSDDESTIRKQISKYSISSVLIMTQERKYSTLDKFIFGKQKKAQFSPIYPINYLDKNPDWKKVYSDEQCVIYYKK